MTDVDWLADRFEQNRSRLRSVAYRMLGSRAEAEDAVQESWLRLTRSDVDAIDGLPGWLTSVVARVCLDMLRARKSQRDDLIDLGDDTASGLRSDADPEADAVLADSVGLALLVVLETLAPVERLAFVLHDMFAMPFEEIAPIVDKSPAATRKLAGCARRRVQGSRGSSEAALARQREVCDAFFPAGRKGDA
jgi:RNA polymerase sigma-70 factor (ECF subfamily)